MRNRGFLRIGMLLVTLVALRVGATVELATSAQCQFLHTDQYSFLPLLDQVQNLLQQKQEGDDQCRSYYRPIQSNLQSINLLYQFNIDPGPRYAGLSSLS
jgi:hypothetical protein